MFFSLKLTRNWSILLKSIENLSIFSTDYQKSTEKKNPKKDQYRFTAVTTKNFIAKIDRYGKSVTDAAGFRSTYRFGTVTESGFRRRSRSSRIVEKHVSFDNYRVGREDTVR